MPRPWSPVQVMQWSKLDSKKPRDQTREDDKLRGPSQKSAESCGTRSFIQLGEKLTTRANMQKGEGSRRLGNWHHAKEAANWAEVGPGWPAQPISGPNQPPFDLAAIRTIYSPEAKSHASIHSSSATEEKRREGHHLGEERIELCWRIKDVSLYDPQAYGPHTFFTTGFPRFLSIRGARGLQAFNLLLRTSY
jgi:hypothetical protein